MKNTIPHTIYLQDGSALNLNKRITKQAMSLTSFLTEIPDPRKDKGKRHSLVLILLIVFIALLRGSKTLKDACLFARYNQGLFQRMGLTLQHGLPDPTTISRVFEKVDPEALVIAYMSFTQALGLPVGTVFSFDGKTMRAVTGEEVVRHIRSLFSHDTHLALGQIGVDSKENEIPAFGRLLDQGVALGVIAGTLLLGDALHTQRATAKAICASGADYLLVVKGNQKGLRQAIQTRLRECQENAAQNSSPKPDSYRYETTGRKRTMTTTVTAITVSPGDAELALPLAEGQHWAQVRTAGILHRTGTRTSKDGRANPVDETIGFISSRVLSAEEAATHLRQHWCIENNLHWVKDEVFGEDKHTLRNGNAPQVMSFLRSMAISLCNALKLKSISDTIHNLEKSTPLLGRFLRMAAVM